MIFSVGLEQEIHRADYHFSNLVMVVLFIKGANTKKSSFYGRLDKDEDDF